MANKTIRYLLDKSNGEISLFRCNGEDSSLMASDKYDALSLILKMLARELDAMDENTSLYLTFERGNLEI